MATIDGLDPSIGAAPTGTPDATGSPAKTPEQLRTLAWSQPDLTDGTHPGLSGETLTLQNEGTFVRYWIVATQPGNFADMKKVTMRVRWTALRPDSVELVSYFRR